MTDHVIACPCCLRTMRMESANVAACDACHTLMPLDDDDPAMLAEAQAIAEARVGNVGGRGSRSSS